MGNFRNEYNETEKILQNYQSLQPLKQEVQTIMSNLPEGRLPIWLRYTTLDWLNRFMSYGDEEIKELKRYLEKGIGDKELGKILTEIGEGKGVVAPIVEKPPYAERPEFPKIENF